MVKRLGREVKQMPFPSVPGRGMKREGAGAMGSAVQFSGVWYHRPQSSIFTFLLRETWQPGSRGSRPVPSKPLRLAALGSFGPPSASTRRSPGEKAMRIRRAGVYISLPVSHLAKHERQALEEKLCSLPLGSQLPFTLPAL